MRYTEVKLSEVSEKMVSSKQLLWKEIIKNKPLGTKLPIALLNGFFQRYGIKTAIPPHNLVEVANACLAYLENPKISLEELLEYIKAPDFPTGGIIMNPEDMSKIYLTGKGKVRIRAKTNIIEKNGHKFIIITEIPYKTWLKDLYWLIPELIKQNRIPGITRMSNCSELRKGVDIRIEVENDHNPKQVLEELFKLTNLETTLDINMKMFFGDKCRRVNLLDIISHFMKNYRSRVITDLMEHLDGLKATVDKLSVGIFYLENNLGWITRKDIEVYKKQKKLYSLSPIKNSLNQTNSLIINTTDELKDVEFKEHLDDDKFHKIEIVLNNLSKEQITILLRNKKRFIREQGNIYREYEEARKEYQRIDEILANEDQLRAVIAQEIEELRYEFGDERRTSLWGNGKLS